MNRGVAMNAVIARSVATRQSSWGVGSSGLPRRFAPRNDNWGGDCAANDSGGDDGPGDDSGGGDIGVASR
jgi:hypothetical protein